MLRACVEGREHTVSDRIVIYLVCTIGFAKWGIITSTLECYKLPYGDRLLKDLFVSINHTQPYPWYCI